MRILPAADDKRLKLLNAGDPSHDWQSCDEERYCIRCEHVFSGRAVRFSWFRRGQTKLHCPTPGCAGGPDNWVHPGNPLVSIEAWEDWERVIRNTEATSY